MRLTALGIRSVLLVLMESLKKNILSGVGGVGHKLYCSLYGCAGSETMADCIQSPSQRCNAPLLSLTVEAVNQMAMEQVKMDSVIAV